MTIKIKFKPDNKAIIRFNDRGEMEFFRFIMTRMRDDPAKNHPPVSVKTPDGREVPKLPEMKPQIVSGQPMQQQAISVQPKSLESPIVVQAEPIKNDTKPEIRYYTNKDLAKENKMQCCNCKHNTENTCKRDKPSEDYYWNANGTILGCINGEAMPVSP
jgi:hypothetical protein